MNKPKTFITTLIIVLFTSAVAAQDTTKNTPGQSKIFAAIEQEPTFPGGIPQFYKYIASNLKYPTVAHLLGLTGKVYISFVVDKDGSVTDVKPVRCLGAGCESEAVRVVSMSPKWQPGIQKGKPVRVMSNVPIAFNLRTESGDVANPSKTLMKNLQNSDYGFAFFIRGKTYSLDEAQEMLGESFDPMMIASAEQCSDPKYAVAGKKETYLVVMKNIFTFVEMEPTPPGGINTFFKYIHSNVHYPEAARLLGINGNVTVDFWIDKTGRVVDVTAPQTLGAGCEYEAKKVVASFPPWHPGIQNGHPVRVHFKVDVPFDEVKKKIAMKELADSDYGFVFSIKDTLYTIEEARAQLGDTFRQSKIESADLFYNPDNEPKFVMTGKKEVYLVKIKS